MTTNQRQPQEASDDQQITPPSAPVQQRSLSDRETHNGANRSIWRRRLLEGVIVGVTAGLVLSSIDFLHALYVERQQMHYIDEIFSASYARLCEMGSEEAESQELLYYYGSTLNSLNLIVDYRSDGISTDKLYDLRLLVKAALRDVEQNRAYYSKNFTVDVTNETFYFNSTAKVSWINAPDKC